MSFASALLGAVCVALLVLFCVCAALLREIVSLRERVDRLAGLTSQAGGGPVEWGLSQVRVRPGDGWLLAVDAACGLCHEVVEGVAGDSSVVLLVHQEEEAWAGEWSGPVRLDPTLWAELAPITPPTLFHVDGSGRIDLVRLPADGREAVDILGTRAGAQKGTVHHA